MTEYDPVEKSFGELTCDDTQQEENTPFSIILVDIRHAATKKEIVCVENPLHSEQDLKYVALSYRWGELPERAIDTGLGYLASITAFDLNDFFDLCSAMMQEIDLKHLNYVWVDAICVDQTNDERRKATIYQMSNIYQRANYILAVPDLHKRSLEITNRMNSKLIYNIHKDRQTVYDLLQGDFNPFSFVDTSFFGGHLRNPRFQRQGIHTGFQTDFQPIFQKPTLLDSERSNDRLKQEIDQNCEEHLEYMNFLMDIVIDWSSDVWAISSCSIAKQKSNLKFWFCMLNDINMDQDLFFKYDFDDPYHPLIPSWGEDDPQRKTFATIPFQQLRDKFKEFYTTMAYQLKGQTFLEMMLKSRASQNEDRFHAILPLTEYKDKLTCKETVASWKISNMVSVKLKLFEIMNNFDKLSLLFMSGHPKSVGDRDIAVFPTFATTTLHFPNPPWMRIKEEDESTCNFDLVDSSTIMFTAAGSREPGLFKLSIKPRVYYRKDNNGQHNILPVQSAWQKSALCKRLQLDDTASPPDVLCIPFVHASPMKPEKDYDIDDDDDDDWSARQIYLIGSFDRNKWTLTTMPHSENVSAGPGWTQHNCDEDKYSTGFNIY